jgi:hypothetical protein
MTRSARAPGRVSKLAIALSCAPVEALLQSEYAEVLLPGRAGAARAGFV